MVILLAQVIKLSKTAKRFYSDLRNKALFTETMHILLIYKQAFEEGSSQRLIYLGIMAIAYDMMSIYALVARYRVAYIRNIKAVLMIIKYKHVASLFTNFEEIEAVAKLLSFAFSCPKSEDLGQLNAKC